MKTREDVLDSIGYREMICWDMAEVFLQNRDAHGIHDMGVEIQALQRAKLELEKLGEQ
jgi:hypothetical protein